MTTEQKKWLITIGIALGIGLLIGLLVGVLLKTPSDTPIGDVFEMEQLNEEINQEKTQVNEYEENKRKLNEYYQKINPNDFRTINKRDSLRSTSIRKGNARRRSEGLDTL